MAKPQAVAPESPPKIMPGHIQDRNLSAAPGAQRGFRNTNEHPLVAALALGRISQDEFDAGDTYRQLFELMMKSGTDSTQFAVSSGGNRTPFTQLQVNAIRAIASVEFQMSRIPDGLKHKTIVRRLCGEGWQAAGAVHHAGYENPKEVWVRARIALNKLATAISRAGINEMLRE